MERIFNDRKELVLKYLSDEPYFNTYIFGDIDKFGLESETVKIFVDDKKAISCVLMDFLGDFVIYSRDNSFNTNPISEYIKSSYDYENCCISGKGSTVDALSNCLPGKKLRKTYLAALENFEYAEYDKIYHSVKQLNEGDLTALLELFCSIDEFKAKYKNYSEEKMLRDMNNGRFFGILGDNGKLVAAAASTAESGFCAMITNVCTHPNHRRKGYAEQILCVLIKSMLDDGIKNICLYYDNPDAARLYKKLGFVQKGIYKTLR